MFFLRGRFFYQKSDKKWYDGWVLRSVLTPKFFDMTKQDLIFLDTETTGTGPEDRLCQVAYSFVGVEHEELFKPPIPISLDAMVVTRITNRMVEGCPSFPGSVMYRNLEQIFVDGGVLVAHNASFDAEMLGREGITIGASIDTYKLAHYFDSEGIIPKYSLQYLRYYYDLEVNDAHAHSALGDVRVLIVLFERYFTQMLESLGDEQGALQEMIRISAEPILLKRFNFGKYTGQEVKQVAHDDLGYLAWLLNQKIMARERGEDNDENWIYTLDRYVNA